MTRFGFKMFQGKFLKDDIDLEKRMNSFFDENRNLIPKSVTITYIYYKTTLTAVVIYEDITADIPDLRSKK
jgi:hypothetical protein